MNLESHFTSKQTYNKPIFKISPDDSNTAIIELSKGKVTILDVADALILGKCAWSVLETKTGWYACRNVKSADRTFQKMYFMHRVIMDTPIDMLTDHKNGDTLNNKRSNLRIVTKKQNNQNSLPHGSNLLYKGVTKRDTNMYEARITDISLGFYKTAEEAARVYDLKAKELFGEHAYLNLN